MKKKLLFVLMGMCMTASAFALTQGELVYTPQGRFQIAGANVNANNAFQSMDGWTVLSATEGVTIADKVNTNANGFAEGMNSVVSLDATGGEGMYYTFVPTSASDTYIVSYKLKGSGAAEVTTRIKTDYLKTNLVVVKGNSDGNYYGTPGEDGAFVENDAVIVNKAEQLSGEWQTFNYAIVGDGTARTYYISFTGMATDIELADLQIAPAIQVANLRQRDAMLQRLNAYRNCYDWPDEVWTAFDGYPEAIASLEAIGDESGQTELDEALATAEEVLADFLNENMDDYLVSNAANYLTTNVGQRLSAIGDWTCWPGGRAFPGDGLYNLGNFAGGNKWGDAIYGVFMKKELDPGSYVFSIEGNANFKEAQSSNCWTTNDGLKMGVANAYIVKEPAEGVEASAADTIATVYQELDPVTFTRAIITAKIAEAGTYEIGYKVACKEALQDLTRGGNVALKNASLFAKTANKYNQRQLTYEADVREQITAGRDGLTKAANYLASAENVWGKTELKACVDTVETKIADYEKLDQEAIIATYQNDYVKSTTEETGYLVYEIYQAGVKDILAANKRFEAVNDTLASIQTAIDNAKLVLVQRVYDAATGKAALQAAIEAAKATQTQMRSVDYSEENAASIVAGIAALNEAVETFKATVPASAIATIVDIDFERDAVFNEETQNYSIAGAIGTMVIDNFSVDGADLSAFPFQQGLWSNGEQVWKGYLRVGNGTGVVAFDPMADGTMGTNILKVSCDYYLQGLNGRNIGFYLKNEADSVIAAFYANPYNGTIVDNTLGIDLASLYAPAGGNYANVAPEGAEGAGAYVNPKNSFEIIIDYGEKSMYCTTYTATKGDVTTDKIAFDGSAPTSFTLQCNYNNSDRRSWFDNLKIQRITAGATEPFADAVETIKTDAKVNGGTLYNLAGQKVGKSFKGIVIKNGKKFVIR